eukprot:CAMPEP_0196996898 /NCGR_PEP_ID=MMETSP1380-20130617/2675_1 /TAXON_ID=5936 /ORGANISM="Euplotes crassus, Strain CT5" /LENGTH=45 /DNA_ID= /DNA_START= /DNA_END= /DNA_ORIENTATION=
MESQIPKNVTQSKPPSAGFLVKAIFEKICPQVNPEIAINIKRYPK